MPVLQFKKRCNTISVIYIDITGIIDTYIYIWYNLCNYKDTIGVINTDTLI